MQKVKNEHIIYPVRKAPLALLDIKYLTRVEEEVRVKLKNFYTFSHGVTPIRKFSNGMNVPSESVLTGFTFRIIVYYF